MHPELFELKALVAGRLDLHRRREIDDHLGSCADCSRHYVAMMLGSSSPKTAEQEARAGHVAAAAVPAFSMAGGGGGGGASLASAYGIDAPLAPPAPKPAPRVPNTSHSLDLDLTTPAAAPRKPAPVSPSLVDAITRLRAESDDAQAAAHAPPPAAPAAAPVVAAAPAAPAAPAPVVAAVEIAPEILAAPESTSLIIEPSIFMPTPLGGVSIINPDGSTATIAAPSDRSRYIATPKEPADVPVIAPTPELVVTFSSTPARFKAQRSPAASRAVAADVPAATVAPAPAVLPLSVAEIEYVSQAVPTSTAVPLSEFAAAAPAPVRTSQRNSVAMMAGGAVLFCGLAFGGYRYFQSSVSQAAAAAAAAAAKQVAAAAATTTPVAPVVAAPAPVQTRVVYVDRPSRKKDDEKAKEAAAAEAQVVQPPTTTVVTLPEVNLQTNAPDAAVQSNSQRSATSELGRNARATAMRTAAPRP